MDDLSWLWHSLVARAVWSLLSVGGAAGLGYLRAKKPALAAPALYGLGGLACFAVIFFAVTGHSLLAPAPVDSSNIEANVKKWTADFGYGIQPVPSQEMGNFEFAYRLAVSNGDFVVVGVDRGKPGYLQFESAITVSPQHQDILAKLTSAQAMSVWVEAETELLRNNFSFQAQGTDPRLVQTMTMDKGVVISGLNEAKFGEAIDNTEDTNLLVRNQFVAALTRISTAPSH